MLQLFTVQVDVGGFGYPAMVVLSHKKMKYSTLTGSFSYDGLNEFLRDLSYGKGRTTPVRGAALPKLATIDAWDGKDGQLPVEEEELDLSDVELDDKDELWALLIFLGHKNTHFLKSTSKSVKDNSVTLLCKPSEVY